MSDPTTAPETFDLTTDDFGFPSTYEDTPAAESVSPTDTPIPSEELPVTTATAAPPAANGTPKAPKAKKEKAPKAKAPKAPKTKKEKAPRTYGGPKVPAGVVQTLPVDSLTFDRKCQSRSQMFDDDTVEKYRLINLDDPDLLPPIKAVDIGDEEAEKRKVTRYIVWDGFQRGRARREAKLKNIAVEVVAGTWEDAIRYSLSANATHGLARTSIDIRRAFDRLINDESLLELAIKDGRGKGGPQSGIARMLAISTGLVSELLNKAGKRVQGEKLVNKPKKADEPAESSHRRSDTDPTGGARVEDPKSIKSRATAAVIKESCFAAAQIQRRYEDLLERDDARDILRELATKNGIPFKRDENTDDGKRVVVTQYWPALDMVLKTLEELQEQHSKMNTGTTA